MNAPRFVLGLSAALPILAGCGASQAPIGAPSAMSHRTTTSPYQVLHSFTNTEAHPQSALININGTLYGTGGDRTGRCAINNCGTVYSLSTAGVYTLMHRFGDPSHGTDPEANLLNVNGTLYGTTAYGGRFLCADGCGTVYSISTSGKYKLLYQFAGGSDGATPRGGLINVNGTLYGTTAYGGGSRCTTSGLFKGCGIVYSIGTSGKETVLHRFSGGSDGADAQGGLINVSGTLYGTTIFGGGSGCSAGGSGGHEGCGTFYSVSMTGSEKVLHRFSGGGNKPWWPNAGLINVNGKLYGTTAQGGSSNLGTVYSITTRGTERVLYSFAGGTDGSLPDAVLINVRGTLYGTTHLGGGSGCFGNGCGTVFRITKAGQETVVHSFSAGADGSKPQAGPIVVNDALFGTTQYGGGRCERQGGCGTVYALTL